VKRANSRQFQIKDAIPANWGGTKYQDGTADTIERIEKCTILIELTNPANNWGKIGLKLNLRIC